MIELHVDDPAPDGETPGGREEGIGLAVGDVTGNERLKREERT
ncbi:MAG: hypothetical protein ABSD38_38290 [Syntrophorhabdales bacterium]|jgi:hypothetical protein